jgi:hypothetical protein
MEVLKPWLNDDYIRRAYFDTQGNFKLWFVDGGRNSYRIDDCSEEQINAAVEILKKHGVSVEGVKDEVDRSSA